MCLFRCTQEKLFKRDKAKQNSSFLAGYIKTKVLKDHQKHSTDTHFSAAQLLETESS